MIADRAVMLVACAVQSGRSLGGAIASLLHLGGVLLSGVLLSGVLVPLVGALLGILVRVTQVRLAVRVCLAGLPAANVGVVQRMVSPQRHGTNTGDYQRYPSGELS